MKLFKSSIDVISKLDQYYSNSDLSYIYKINREKLVKIINTFELIQTTNQITIDDWDIIEKGLHENWFEIYFTHVGEYLALLEPEHPEISKRLLALMASKKYIIRRNIVDICMLFINKTFSRAILKIGVQDKSYRVFENAFYIISTNYINDTELMSLVNNQLNLIPESEQKNDYLRSLELVKKGYLINAIEGNKLNLKLL